MAPPDRFMRCSSSASAKHHHHLRAVGTVAASSAASLVTHSVLDLAQIRALVDSTGGGGGGLNGSASTSGIGISASHLCPSCEMPFDKGKKRRLIDSCGHDRCYSCLVRTQICPLCSCLPYSNNNFNASSSKSFEDDDDEDDIDADDDIDDDYDEENDDENESSFLRPKGRRTRGFAGSRQSSAAGGDWLESASLCARQKNSKNFKTSTIKANDDVKLLKGKPPILPESRLKSQDMTKSCPTPPSQRKKFFLNGKLRSPFGSSAHKQLLINNNNNNNKRERSTENPADSESPSAISEDEGIIGTTKETNGAGVGQSTRRSGNSDLYMRLGLLLGNDHHHQSSSSHHQKLRSAPATRASSVAKNETDQTSSARLPPAAASTNTSPVSTLTGASSEAEICNANNNNNSNGSSARATLRGGISAACSPLLQHKFSRLRSSAGKGSKKYQQLQHQQQQQTSSNAGSVASISTSASTSMSMSQQSGVSISGLSNASSTESPRVSRRRHSVTNGQIVVVGDQQQQAGGSAKNSRRHQHARRSARAYNYKGPGLDPQIRFLQQQAQLQLKPLFFEVPQVESEPLFVGRQWLLQELKQVVEGTAPGALVVGSPGTGKTALVLQLVDRSCFGRKHKADHRTTTTASLEIGSCTESLLQDLATSVVAYHFCQTENNATCLVPDLVHSLAAQLCQAPQLAAYREYLLSEPHLQGALSQKECTVDPDLALQRGVLEPLQLLRRAGRLPDCRLLVLVDAVCAAEYHAPDRGDTVASFLARHAAGLPSWLKLVVTVRSQLVDQCAKQLAYPRLCLDSRSGSGSGGRAGGGAAAAAGLQVDQALNVSRDLADYINLRISQSPAIQANVTAAGSQNHYHHHNHHQTTKSSAVEASRFAAHLLNLAQGSFLFAKMTLDLLESGHLVAKSSSYKVLPVSLAQIYQLHFNLRFPTDSSFERVSSILGVCLAALSPLTLPEIYRSCNSLENRVSLAWEDFLQRFKMLSGFLVKRLDDTYMFFHPSFREWLIRRDEGESFKFQCDLRHGHAAHAFRLTKLEAPLDGERTLELGHHVLKAHLFRGCNNTNSGGGTSASWPSRDLQAVWLATASQNTSAALCTLRNVYSPNVKVSRLLLLAGASPDAVTDYLGSAPILCMYAHEGSCEMVSLLLDFGANVDLANSQGCTALILAAARGHCDVVRRLAAAGATLGRTDTSRQCALVHAARRGRLAVVGYLLACDWLTTTTTNNDGGHRRLGSGRNVDRDEAALQALVAAAAQGHEAVVEFLLDMSEVGVDEVDTLLGETALSVAAANGSTTTVSALLARGAAPEVPNAKGLTPLMLAAREGNWATAERLLQPMGSLNGRRSNEDGGETQTTRLLKQRDPEGMTALMLAAQEGHANLCELLLDKGAQLEDQDVRGHGALTWACMRGRVQAVQLLLERGADVAACDRAGRSPLDLAACQVNPKIVQLLLDKGAAIEHVDHKGMRPLDRAIGSRNLPVVQSFLRLGAKLGPVTWTCASGKPDMLLVLLNKLLEDGNVLFRKSRFKEAGHRYIYALKKFPEVPEASDQPEHEDRSNRLAHAAAFVQLRINFLLNLSRCKRKTNEFEEANEIADEVLKIRPHSFEAYYARARGNMNLDRLEEALRDCEAGLRHVPEQARHDRRAFRQLREQILSMINGTEIRTDKSGQIIVRASIDRSTEL
ncbi:protein TANC2 [Trichogramma pretiosum]|uniref:protein TANC2 n=1 Tax=Trichogramma pretiosum TaxID=7493 RepID=UPI000C718D52|nr:protein TANC2 [Trichogramma pretiosum]